MEASGLVFLLCFCVLTLSASGEITCGENEVIGKEGCKCVGGYKRDEKDNTCVFKFPVLKTIIGEPLKATKYGVKRTEKKFGHFLGKLNVWAEQSIIKIESDLKVVVDLFLIKPTEGFVALSKKLGHYFSRISEKVYKLFVVKPLRITGRIFVKVSIWTGGLFKATIKLLGKITNEVYILVFKKPLRLGLDITKEITRATEVTIKYVADITKAVFKDVYILTVQKPLETLKHFNIWLKTRVFPRVYEKTRQIVEGLDRAFASISEETKKDTRAFITALYNLTVKIPTKKIIQINNWLKKNIYPAVYKTFVTYPLKTTEKILVFLEKSIETIFRSSAKFTRAFSNAVYVLFVKKPTETFEEFNSWLKKHFYPFVGKYFIKGPTDNIEKVVEQTWNVMIVISKRTYEIFIVYPGKLLDGIMDSMSKGWSGDDSVENSKEGDSHKSLWSIFNDKAEKEGSALSKMQPGSGYTVLSSAEIR